jgi:hypothetical protein
MKKAVISVTAAAGLWILAQNVSTPRPLSEITPAGAVLYLEARNLAGLIADWDQSQEKPAWLSGASYQAFMRSRLFLRLKEVFDQYAAATGVPPDMTLLRSVAGAESALAIYDVGSLEFLYLTRVPAARAMESLLWRAREKFSARNAGGAAYYILNDAASRRSASFAISGDLLLIATRETALAGALQLLAGAGGAATVRGESWFQNASAASAQPGDLRMLLQMERLVQSPSFRSYWVQRNVSDLRAFHAGIVDLRRLARAMIEDRALLRSEPAPAPDASAVAGLMPLAANAGVYRAWAQPTVAAAAQLIAEKILLAAGPSAAPSKSAPPVSIESSEPGLETDLESRLDEAPLQTAAAYQTKPLIDWLDTARPAAMLYRQSSRLARDNVFVSSDSLVALAGRNNWDVSAVRMALELAVRGLDTVSSLGFNWRQRRAGSDVIWEIDGLRGLAIAVRGRTLLLATRGEYLETVLSLPATANAPTGTYLAGYRPAAELPNYIRIMRMIEFPQRNPDPNVPQELAFFSGNLASLATALNRVDSVSVIATDDGKSLKQTVTYQLSR